MQGKISNKEEIIKCSRCRATLAKQIRGKTTKQIRIVSRIGGIQGPLVEKIKNYKLVTITLTCLCGKENLLQFMFEDLKGVGMSFKGESLEVFQGKRKRVTKGDEKNLKRIYIKLKP